MQKMIYHLSSMNVHINTTFWISAWKYAGAPNQELRLAVQDGGSGMGFQDLKETQEDLGPEPVPSGVENIPVPWCWQYWPEACP